MFTMTLVCDTVELRK